jgi:hypothetical protein
VDVAGEAKSSEIVDEIATEPTRTGEPIELSLREAHGLKERKRLSQARGNHKPTPRRQLAKEELERRQLCFARVVVSI